MSNDLNIDPENFLRSLYRCAVIAAGPDNELHSFLPEKPDGKVVVVGAGKAAASMAKAVEDCWGDKVGGLVVTRYGHGLPLKYIQLEEASHPTPDEAGYRVSKKIVELVSDLKSNDLVLCLISGGASSLLTLPPPQISLAEKQQINKALLRSGASIKEINCVRKHLSLIKGGRLAVCCQPAKVLTLAISDVPEDDPQVIGSGPTVYDSSTSNEALNILTRYKVNVSQEVVAWLSSSDSESIKEESQLLINNEYEIIATPQSALLAAAACCKHAGIDSMILSDCIEGEAREVAKVHAAIAKQVAKYGQPLKPPCVLISGGETTVSVKGEGRGGRNTEFMLSLLAELEGHRNIYGLAADTDGIDGTEDNAGAWITPDCSIKAFQQGLSAPEFLDNNDSYSFFSELKTLFFTGPTLTNVNDFRALLILSDD